MINLYLIKVGDKIRLTDGRVGECVDNMGDGQWIEANFFEDNGNESQELVHSQDISEHLQ